MSMVQRRLVSLGALMLITIGVGSAVWWQNQWAGDKAQKQQVAQQLFSTQEAAKIREVRLNTPTGTYVVKKEGDAWQITAPHAAAADSSAIDTLVRAALQERVTARVGGSGPKDDMTQTVPAVADLSVFGLAAPQYTLSLINDQNVTESVLVGKRNTFDNSLYVKRSDHDDVGLVAGNFLYQVNKDFFALREKRPVPLTLDAIDEITVKPEHSTGYAMKRVKDRFVLTAPLQTPTDNIAAENIAGALTGLRAKSFVTEQAPSSAMEKTFGLDKPQYVVRVTTQDKQAYTLRLSTATLEGGTRYFAMADAGGPVLEIGSDWAQKKLSTPLNQLRDKHVVASVRESVRAIEISRGNQHVTLAAVLGNKLDDGMQPLQWHLEGPKGQEVVPNKVDGLLFALENLKGEDIAADVPTSVERAKFGLETPALHVVLKDDTGQVITGLRVGQSGIPTDKLVWASPSSMQPVFVVDKKSVDQISADPNDYIAGGTKTPSANNF